MNFITHAEVPEYPYGITPEEGYEYAEFHNSGDDNQGYHMSHLEEDIPAGWEEISSPILTDSGWRILARRPDETYWDWYDYIQIQEEW